MRKHLLTTVLSVFAIMATAQSLPYQNGKFPNSNIAIKGLFTNVTTTPDGYYKKDWGKAIVSQEETNGFYYEDLFKGWDYKTAPIYLVPISQNGLIGGLTNGYGFTSEF